MGLVVPLMCDFGLNSGKTVREEGPKYPICAYRAYLSL